MGPSKNPQVIELVESSLMLSPRKESTSQFPEQCNVTGQEELKLLMELKLLN